MQTQKDNHYKILLLLVTIFLLLLSLVACQSKLNKTVNIRVHVDGTFFDNVTIDANSNYQLDLENLSERVIQAFSKNENETIGIRWFLDPAFQKPLIDDTQITKNTTIYAKQFKSTPDDFEYDIAQGKITITDFKGNGFIEEVAIPKYINSFPVISIASGAFKYESKLCYIVVGDKVTEIGEEAFYGCSSLQNIKLSENTTSIGDSAFFDCSSLTSITIPTKVKSISANMFRNCAKLKTVSFAENSQCSDIGFWAFYECTSLTSISLPKSIRTVDSYAFRHCQALASIEVENGNPAYYSNSNCLIETASNTLILGCNTSIIPEGIINIGTNAFNGCPDLTSIVIPSNVKFIQNGAFTGCQNLTSIKVANGNKEYRSEGNCLIQTASKTLVVGCKTSVIPASVTNIGYSAFEECTGLTNIIIPKSVTNISRAAFQGCDNLMSITLPFVGATKDGTENTHLGYIFGGMSNSPFTHNDHVPTSLKEVIITGSNSIDRYAFYGCDALTSVTIPSSVTSIGKYAFQGCDSLTKIFFDDTSTWYYTLYDTGTGGTEANVSNPGTCAKHLKSNYCTYYWYKK